MWIFLWKWWETTSFSNLADTFSEQKVTLNNEIMWVHSFGNTFSVVLSLVVLNKKMLKIAAPKNG